MALDKQPRAFWSRVHFGVRFLGLTGLAVACVGLALALIDSILSWAQLQQTWTDWQEAAGLGAAPATPVISLSLLLGGLLVAGVALLVELLVVARLMAGRRSAAGGVVALQLVLATFLLIAVNVYTTADFDLSIPGTDWHLEHRAQYARIDLTRNQQFTLPAELQAELAQLRGETRIIVYLPHQTLGQRTGSLDPEVRAYVSAAEHQIVEKLKDAVTQFRELGPKFHVVVLDVNDWQNYKEKLDAATKDMPELRRAIKDSPENAVFFVAQGKVQRLSFADLFLLDQPASVKDNQGKGNLVLLDQGIEPLARKILAINEMRPRVAIASIHEVLSTGAPADHPFSLAGVRKALEARGFEVKDIVLKRWGGQLPEPAVYTIDDSRLDDLEDSLDGINENLGDLRKILVAQEKVIDSFRTASLAELTKRYAAFLGEDKITAELRKEYLARFEIGASRLRDNIAELNKRRSALEADLAKLDRDSLAEGRRMTDSKEKLRAVLADCDLLILHRLTLNDISRSGWNLPMWYHGLDPSQTDVLRDFVKSGKPVLACFGPDVDIPGEGTPPGMSGTDGVVEMLRELGVKFNRQAVLFDAEMESFRVRRETPLSGTSVVLVPPLEFDWEPGTIGRSGRQSAFDLLPRHPIRQSMHLAARSIGQDAQGTNLFDLRVRHLQTLAYDPPKDVKPAENPVLTITHAASWNEDQPFRAVTRNLRDLAKTDPESADKQRGPFSVAVAFQRPVPADWFDKDDKRRKAPPSVRIAVIGHGGLFNGAELPPPRELLLLNTVNWLLGRDLELPQKETAWKYPRVDLSERDAQIWQTGAVLGLPLLFAYLGVVVVMLRRLR